MVSRQAPRKNDVNFFTDKKDGRAKPLRRPVGGMSDDELWERRKRCLKRADYRDKHHLLQRIHRDTYGSLHFYEKKDPKKLKEGAYRYIITNGAIAHTAFHTKEGLDRWLKDTGIKLSKQTDHWGHPLLKGTYSKISMSGNQEKLDAWAQKRGLRKTKILDNAKFTTAWIKEGKRGNTIYYLNPNYSRDELPYVHE